MPHLAVWPACCDAAGAGVAATAPASRQGRDRERTGAVAKVTLEQVLCEHGALLARVVATYEHDQAHREELWQEVLLAIWRALPGFRGDAGVRTFVARIAHNRCVSHVAREARRPASGPATVLDETPADPVHHPHQQLLAEQTFSQLLAAVAALPLGPRQVISLALEGFSTTEIAEALGISSNNVAVRLNRARTALRQWLER
jgi:RNA polymerase sigma factor (sigma-70 family)